MEAAPRGAKELGGFTIGILPKAIAQINEKNESKEWPSSHIDVAIFTGLGGGIKGRNQVIVSSCDAIIALPGTNRIEKGTRSEIELAKKYRVPLVLHEYWREVTPPGPERIRENGLLIQYFDGAEDAVEKAKDAIEAKSTKLTTSRR